MLDREIRRAIRSEPALGILMLDLNHFKNFNNAYGHDGGDAVLRETASFLVRSIRAEDFVCRFGGEEFVVVLPTVDLRAARGPCPTYSSEAPRSRDCMMAAPWDSLPPPSEWPHSQIMGRTNRICSRPSMPRFIVPSEKAETASWSPRGSDRCRCPSKFARSCRRKSLERSPSGWTCPRCSRFERLRLLVCASELDFHGCSGMTFTGFSRDAAQECSPWRKPWVADGKPASPEGAKE